MGNTGLLTIVLVLGCLEAFAFSRQRRHYVAPQYCGAVSYLETNRHRNNFTDMEIGKTCLNIDPSLPAVLSLDQRSSLCNYEIEAYSLEDCDDNKIITNSFNSENDLVKLNDWNRRFPVCSFRVYYQPNPGYFIHFKFLEPTYRHNDKIKSHHVTSAGCYNLCGLNSNFYPYTMQANIIKSRTQDYNNIIGISDVTYNANVTLFSTLGCGYYDEPGTDSVVGNARNGDNLVALSSVPFEVRSYTIVSNNDPRVDFKK